MTMLTIYAQNPKGHDLFNISEMLDANHELWTDLREMEEYKGEAGIMGCAGISVEAHISVVDDIVQTLEHLMDMKVVVVW